MKRYFFCSWLESRFACARFVWTILICLSPTISAAAQAPKKSASPASEKAVAKYHVDFRIQISSDLDKQRAVIWVNLLKELGAAGVSQVPGEPAPPKAGEKTEPAIESGGGGRVIVKGILGPSGNLFIGMDGFKMADRAKLAALIKSLQAEGVPGPDATAPMWGLGQSQIELLQGELKQHSEFELKDKPFDAFLNDLRGRVKLQIKVTPEAKQFGKGLKLNAETHELTLGAALAYVLGQNGLAWEPRHAAGSSVTILIMPREDSRRPWPVGLEADQLPGNIAPNLMASARFQTNDTPLEDVLAGFRRNLKMEVLLDRAALIEHDVNPDTLRSTMQIPNGTFHSAIKKTLGPMGLKYELRIDEANRAFLWVTWSEPTGPTKKK